MRIFFFEMLLFFLVKLCAIEVKKTEKLKTLIWQSQGFTSNKALTTIVKNLS